MNEEEKLKDLKAVYSGAVQSGEIVIANMIKGGIDLIEKLQKYSLYKEEFSRLNQQLQSKDKIIDLMEEYISNIADCPFESEGKYLDCEKMCDVRTDKECWKQYFKNKAKEVKND